MVSKMHKIYSIIKIEIFTVGYLNLFAATFLSNVIFNVNISKEIFWWGKSNNGSPTQILMQFLFLIL